MSDTPRTDEEEYQTWSEGNQGMGEEYAEHVAPSSLARQLERELHIATEAGFETARELAAMTAAKNKALEALKECEEVLNSNNLKPSLYKLIAELEVK